MPVVQLVLFNANVAVSLYFIIFMDFYCVLCAFSRHIKCAWLLKKDFNAATKKV